MNKKLTLALFLSIFVINSSHTESKALCKNQGAWPGGKVIKIDIYSSNNELQNSITKGHLIDAINDSGAVTLSRSHNKVQYHLIREQTGDTVNLTTHAYNRFVFHWSNDHTMSWDTKLDSCISIL